MRKLQIIGTRKDQEVEITTVGYAPHDCVACFFHTDTADGMANARRFVASSELLAAAEEAEKILTKHGFGGTHPDEVQRLRAAIRAAKGEQ